MAAPMSRPMIIATVSAMQPLALDRPNLDAPSPSARQQLSEHVRQNSTVPVVVDLIRRVDARDGGERARLAVLTFDPHRVLLTWRETLSHAVDVEHLAAGETQARRILAGF